MGAATPAVVRALRVRTVTWSELHGSLLMQTVCHASGGYSERSGLSLAHIYTRYRGTAPNRASLEDSPAPWPRPSGQISPGYPRGWGGPKFRAGGFGVTRAREDRRHMGPHMLLLWPPGCSAPEAHRAPAQTHSDAESRTRHAH